jgi:hypothetical protein
MGDRWRQQLRLWQKRQPAKAPRRSIAIDSFAFVLRVLNGGYEGLALHLQQHEHVAQVRCDGEEASH